MTAPLRPRGSGLVRIVEIRESTVRLSGDVRNAVVSFADHTVSLVAVITDVHRDGRPVVGVAFNSIGRFGQAGILRERMIPRLLAGARELISEGGDQFDVARVRQVAMQNEKQGGHGDRAAAMAALELAFWDCNAKLLEEPAYHTISRALSDLPPAPDVDVYAAGGYYLDDDDPVAGLIGELRGYLEEGYRACKIKIGGASLGDDLARVERAIEVFGAPERVAVDANGRFSRDDALAYADALAPYGLRWFEEPCDPLDYELLSDIIEAFPQPVATGENLFSLIDTLNLLRFGGLRPGMDVFQMDAGLSYGLAEYAAMLDAMEQAGHPRAMAYPHGGHLINLHIVQALRCGGCEAYPGVFQPFGGYPPQIRPREGRIAAPEVPGFGLETKPELRPHLDELTA